MVSKYHPGDVVVVQLKSRLARSRCIIYGRREVEPPARVPGLTQVCYNVCAAGNPRAVWQVMEYNVVQKVGALA